MGGSILSGKQLKKVFDGTVAVDDVSFAIEEKTITAIIGPNGAGKTTLFNLITGFVAPDAGEISLQGNSLNGTPPYKIAQKGVSRTFQDLRLLRQLSVRDNLLLACPNQKGESFWPALLSSQVRKQTRAIEATLRIMDFVGLPSSVAANLRQIFYGSLMVLTMLYRPQGLIGEFNLQK